MSYNSDIDNIKAYSEEIIESGMFRVYSKESAFLKACNDIETENTCASNAEVMLHLKEYYVLVEYYKKPYYLDIEECRDFANKLAAKEEGQCNESYWDKCDRLYDEWKDREACK